jgi:hypothetical protein
MHMYGKFVGTGTAAGAALALTGAASVMPLLLAAFALLSLGVGLYHIGRRIARA